MNEVRMGIIGFGNMGTAHAKSLIENKVPKMKLGAICDIAEARREIVKNMYPEVQAFDDYITVKSNGKLKSTNIQTLPYPGFPTDMHPQFSTLLAIAEGDGTVYETIWKNRFKYVAELEKMGASVIVNEPFAAFHGVERLHGASVESVDLRAGAAIVIAGLVADGTTEVTNIYTIERGYLDIVGKLKSLGADISKYT